MPDQQRVVNFLDQTAIRDIFMRQILAALVTSAGLATSAGAGVVGSTEFVLNDLNIVPCTGDAFGELLSCEGELGTPSDVQATGSIWLDDSFTVGSVVDAAEDIYMWNLTVSLLDDAAAVIESVSYSSADGFVLFFHGAYFDVLASGLAPNLDGDDGSVGEIVFGSGETEFGSAIWGYYEGSTVASGGVAGVQTIGAGSGTIGASSANVVVANGSPPPAVPLPAGLPLLLTGVAAFGLARRRTH